MEWKENMGFLLGRAGKALHDGRKTKILDARVHRIGGDVLKLDAACRGNFDYLGRRNDIKTIGFVA